MLFMGFMGLPDNFTQKVFKGERTAYSLKKLIWEAPYDSKEYYPGISRPQRTPGTAPKHLLQSAEKAVGKKEYSPA